MLRCYRTRRRIGAFLDDALGDRESSRAVAHISACGRCRAEIADWQRLASLLKRSAPEPAPPDWTGFWPGILRAIEAPSSPSRARLRWRPRLVAAGAAAALAGVVSVALWEPWSSLTPPAVAAISVNSADTSHPRGTVVIYTPPEKDLAVVWLLADD